MKRKFKHTTDGHNKWWDIEVDGSTYTVTYGRIGGKGDERTKTFPSATKAQQEADKMIASKLDKGYVEDFVAPKVYSKDDSTIEGRINMMLAGFALAHNVDITYIEDCEFRDEPRAMEFDRKYADDPEMEPLREIALAIDMHILGTPRSEAAESNSPYVRDCAKWYSQKWDVMFTHDTRAAADLIMTVKARGADSLRIMGIEPVYNTPVGRSLILPDRVIKDPDVMVRMGRSAPEGSVWIISNDRAAERYLKVCSAPEIWCPLM